MKHFVIGLMSAVAVGLIVTAVATSIYYYLDERPHIARLELLLKNDDAIIAGDTKQIDDLADRNRDLRAIVDTENKRVAGWPKAVVPFEGQRLDQIILMSGTGSTFSYVPTTWCATSYNQFVPCGWTMVPR